MGQWRRWLFFTEGRDFPANVFPIGSSSTEVLNARAARENIETVCLSVVNLTMKNTSKKKATGYRSAFITRADPQIMGVFQGQTGK